MSYATLNYSCKLHDTCFSWSFWCLEYSEKSISLSWLTKKSDSDFFNSRVDLCLLICFCLICVRCWTTDLFHLTSNISSSGSLCIQTWALRHVGLFLFAWFLLNTSLHVLHQVLSCSNKYPVSSSPSSTCSIGYIVGHGEMFWKSSVQIIFGRTCCLSLSLDSYLLKDVVRFPKQCKD